jgi:hypothetical protein
MGVDVGLSAIAAQPSWRAQARHPRLCFCGQKAWMPICIGMTDDGCQGVNLNGYC